MAPKKLDGVTIPATDEAPPAILIEVAVPADLATNLQIAAGPNKTVGDQLVDIAYKFGGFAIGDRRSMVIPGEVRGELESIVGRGIQSASDLLNLIRRSHSLRVGSVAVTVPDDVLELLAARLYDRVGDHLKTELEKFIQRAFEALRLGTL